jgi:hypothetical protein
LVSTIQKIRSVFLNVRVGTVHCQLFVSVAAPSFQFKNRGWKNREYHRMKHENRRLRERVERLERERLNHVHELDINVPPPPMPPAPPAFSVPRRDR